MRELPLALLRPRRAVGFAAIQFLIGPFIMDLTLRFAYSGRFVDYLELPEHLQHFVADTCQKHGTKQPRVAVIADLSPNASGAVGEDGRGTSCRTTPV
ncbi:MAG: hypothetical protein OXT09_10170 [Myxococcales bacterium]|nr:hypothetical protein [Myxococcales bacterium]